MNKSLKTIRENLGYTQKDVANLLYIPLNTLRNWEQDQRTPSEWTINLVIDKLLMDANNQFNEINESNGVLSFLKIKKDISFIAKQYDVNRVYLFGSYAKGNATEFSDIDLYMESNLYGLDYFEFAEVLREKLNKKIELLSQLTTKEDSKIRDEIKKTGVLIYERQSIY